TLLAVRPLAQGASAFLVGMQSTYTRLLPDQLQLRLTHLEPEDKALRRHGLFFVSDDPHAAPLLEFEVGLHLDCEPRRPLEPGRMDVFTLPPDADAVAFVRELVQKREDWLQAAYRGAADLAADPLPVGVVAQVYPSEDVIDLRTGASWSVAHSILDLLPLP